MVQVLQQRLGALHSLKQPWTAGDPSAVMNEFYSSRVGVWARTDLERLLADVDVGASKYFGLDMDLKRETKWTQMKARIQQLLKAFKPALGNELPTGSSACAEMNSKLVGNCVI